MKVTVFGGSGYIGSHVADELTARGHKVRVFDIRKSPYLKIGQEMAIGDINDEKKVAEAVKGAEYVYNFAGISDLDTAVTKPIETIKQNVLGNGVILDKCVEAKVRRFVYASTIYVYSSLGGFYKCSKQSAEVYVEEFQRRHGLDFTIVRYGTVYGPRSDERNSIYRYIKSAMDTGKIVCNGTGDEMREYINVRDAAKLSVDVLEPAYANQYVTITGHQAIRFRDMLRTIKEMLGGKVEIEFKPDKNGAHYDITPYSFSPRIGRKLVNNYYVDLGQGLLECMEEMHRKKG